MAIGNPFGFTHTITVGVISAVERQPFELSAGRRSDMIQTDAAINPGNSGGPLLDNAGRLIGVNTAIYSPSGASAGIGFAVPVDTVFRIVPELITHGRVVRPVLGVGLADDQVNAYVQRQLGVEGALVYQVYRGTGAAEAGLRPTVRDRSGRMALGDVIQEIDDKPVRSRSDLLGRLGGYKPGDASRRPSRRDTTRAISCAWLNPSRSTSRDGCNGMGTTSAAAHDGSPGSRSACMAMRVPKTRAFARAPSYLRACTSCVTGNS